MPIVIETVLNHTQILHKYYSTFIPITNLSKNNNLTLQMNCECICDMCKFRVVSCDGCYSEEKNKPDCKTSLLQLQLTNFLMRISKYGNQVNVIDWNLVVYLHQYHSYLCKILCDLFVHEGYQQYYIFDCVQRGTQDDGCVMNREK